MFKKIFFLSAFTSILSITVLPAQNHDPLNIIDVQHGTHICNLPPTNINANFFVQSSPELLERMKRKTSATFEVEYFSSCGDEEWPQEAITAFEFAVAIWSEHINSDVPIKVNANWMTLEGSTLGSARPSRIVQVGNAGVSDTWYTLAQLSAMRGQAIREQLDEVEYDIDMNVQCNYDDWYFGTDANVPDGYTDFVTVVLHEIGHGIGFLGSMEAENDSETASWGLGGDDPDPLIFDRFTTDGDETNLINATAYPNPSSELYSALTGDRGGVFFNGTDTNNSLRGSETDRAILYSPDPFNEGSSYSHMDHVTFRQSINALMVPFIDRAFAIHTPGPLFCGMLSDIGWPLGDGCLDFIQSSVLVMNSENLNFGVLNSGESSEVTLILSNQNDAEDILAGNLEISNDQFSIVGDSNFSLEPGESKEFKILYSPVTDQRHTGTLSVIHNAKNVPSPFSISLEGEALRANQIVELDQSYPNPFVLSSSQSLGMPVIEFAISQESDVVLDLFSVSGQHLQSLVSDRMQSGRYRESVDLNGLSSGIYIYRIVVDGVAKSGKLMYVR